MERKAQIIALANQKGGVAKTTTCHVLAHGLANRGWKVLVVDADPQENLTGVFDATREDLNIYHMFRKEKTATDCIQNVKPNLDIIAGGELMAGADMEFSSAGREYLLRESLEEIKDNYDYIIIDTPPSLGIITINVFMAADRLIIPMGADKFSVQGFSQLLKTIGTVSKYFDNGLQIDGILITRNEGTNIAKAIRKSLEGTTKQLNIRFFDTVIRKGVAIQEAQYLQADPFEVRAKEGVVKDYGKFIDELLADKKEVPEIALEKLVGFRTGGSHLNIVRDDEEMEALIESIKAYGVMKPIKIRPDKEQEGRYEIISGHRRFFAAGKAGMTTIPYLMVDCDDEQALELAHRENHSICKGEEK